MPLNYSIVKGLKPPLGRPPKRKNLNSLITLANRMQNGDAVLLTLSQANQFRIILAAQGWLCLTDGYRSPIKSKIYAFKLWPATYSPQVTEPDQKPSTITEPDQKPSTITDRQPADNSVPAP